MTKKICLKGYEKHIYNEISCNFQQKPNEKHKKIFFE